ncbi:ribonuclease HII [Halobacillus campisalis]|uniref:Ribonuclease HII n=1 Tax=Halobacillus campisalis TaxID=435909 RepID=A0ABW2K169_9BACI|nr:ribonuclease HII [Halobacillus campisalis]
MEFTYTIKDLKNKFENESLSEEELKTFREDERKGVQKLIAQYDKKAEQQQLLKRKFQEMMHHENVSKQQGKLCIAGIDEAGRGPLAGPVVASAVVLPDNFYLPGINDSKQLSLSKREEYFIHINQHAEVGVGIVSSQEIDEINIYNATKLAMNRAVENLTDRPDHLLIDAMSLSDAGCTQQSLIKGDEKSVSIAAASIIAKVTRDRMMQELAETYPSYDFHSNQGYGTKNHLDALKKHGPTPHHRRSFSPVKASMSS